MATRNTRKKTKPRRNELAKLVPAWRRYLRTARTRGGKSFSEITMRNYLSSLTSFAAYLDAHGLVDDESGASGPITLADITTDDLQMWIDGIADRTSGNNAIFHWRNMRAFWRWIVVEEKELPSTEDPMATMPRPLGEEVDRTPFSDRDIKAMLKVCSGASFADRRDHAIIRLFDDTGVRVGGLTGMLYDPDYPHLDNQRKNDVFLDEPIPLVRFRLKGGKPHFVDIGSKTAVALDRYLRARERHDLAHSPYLWLGQDANGEQLQVPGVEHMIRRRAKEANVKGRAFPHRFRRTTATVSLASGLSPATVQARLGWERTETLRLYISASAKQLAWEESQRHAVGDRI